MTRALGRPSKVTPFAEQVRAWIEADAQLPTQELLRRAIECGYDGRKSAFYALVAGLRRPRGSPMAQFEGLPGEFSQHDFGHVDVPFANGGQQRVRFFASRLTYSQFLVVTLIENDSTETVVRCMLRDFVQFGGLPLLALFDRPAVADTGEGGREVEAWNAAFAQAIVDIGVGVEMCPMRSSHPKGALERLAWWVEASFFQQRRFQDAGDLAAQLAAWLNEVNTRTPAPTTAVIPEARRCEELARLRPVKVGPEELALRIPVVVGPSAEVLFDGVCYALPAATKDMRGTLFLYQDWLRIVVGRSQSAHRRQYHQGYDVAALAEHGVARRAALHGSDRRFVPESRDERVRKADESCPESASHS